MKTILFIDWENFKKRLEEVFEEEEIDRPMWHEYNFLGLFNKVLQGIEIDQKKFYAAKLTIHPLTKKKSEELVEEQRLLKNSLEKQDFEFIYGGRVRGNIDKHKKSKKSVIFKEKGVDVTIAVDMVSMAYEKELKTAVLASSDSDLQPAIKKTKEQGVKCIYLGFEASYNKGLSYTTERTILIRNAEVLDFLPQRLFDK